MLSRASTLRRAAYPISRAANAYAQRRALAEQAVAEEGSKLKFNFFLPHDAIKSNAEVVRFVALFKTAPHHFWTLVMKIMVQGRLV